MKKRLLSLLLTLTMIVAMIPMITLTTFAEEYSYQLSNAGIIVTDSSGSPLGDDECGQSGTDSYYINSREPVIISGEFEGTVSVPYSHSVTLVDFDDSAAIIQFGNETETPSDANQNVEVIFDGYNSVKSIVTYYKNTYFSGYGESEMKSISAAGDVYIDGPICMYVGDSRCTEPTVIQGNLHMIEGILDQQCKAAGGTPMTIQGDVILTGGYTVLGRVDPDTGNMRQAVLDKTAHVFKVNNADAHHVAIYSESAGYEDTECYFVMDGVRVTDENKGNIFKDHPELKTSGKASYDPDTQTLTLSSFSAAKNDKYKYYSGDDKRNETTRGIDASFPLNIKVIGTNTFSDFNEAIRIYAGESRDTIDIKGSGSLIMNGHHFGSWGSEGLEIDSSGTINISCKKISANGFDSAHRIDCDQLNITSEEFIVTSEADNDYRIDFTADTTFDGCKKVSIDTPSYGITTGTTTHYKYTIKNCHDFYVSTYYYGIDTDGTLTVDNSTVRIYAVCNAIGLEDELIVRNNASLYARGGYNAQKEDEDGNYGLIFDEEDGNKITVTGGRLQLTGLSGAAYSDDGEIVFDAGDQQVLGSTQQDFFTKEEMQEVTFADGTAKIGDDVAKSLMVGSVTNNSSSARAIITAVLGGIGIVAVVTFITRLISKIFD